MRQFSQETVGELKKSTWPTREELRASVVVVFVAMTVLGAFVSIVDFSIYNVIDLFTMLVKGS